MCGTEYFLKSWKSLRWSKFSPPFTELKVYYRVHNSLPLDSIMNQLNPVHTH
jgi:hypothetical protein